MASVDATTSERLKSELIAECNNQYENCLYTAVSLHEFLKHLQWRKSIFVTAAIVCGSLGSLSIFTHANDWTLKVIGSILTWLAGLSPAFFTALRFEQYIEDCKNAAAEFTNLSRSVSAGC